MTDPTPCPHDDAAVTPNGQPTACGACGVVLVPVTFPATAVVHVETPAPLRTIRCPDDTDTDHAEHPWDAAVGPWGDVLTVWCDGQPRATTETPEDQTP